MPTIRLVLLAACCGAALAAGEATRLMPEGARWMLHLDVAALAQGAAGDWVGELGAHSEIAPRLRGFTLITGLDPLRDLSAVTLYGSDQRPEQAVLALRGRFDAERLIALAAMAQDYRREARGGFDVHSWFDPQQQRRAHAAFPAPDLLIFSGSTARVVAAAAELAAWRPPAPAGSKLIAIGAVDGIHALTAAHPQAAQLRHLVGGALRLSERGDDVLLTLRLIARDETSAGHLVKVLDGLRSLALLDEQQDRRLLELFGRVQLQREGAAISIDLSLPLAELRSAGEALRAQRERQRSAP